MTELSPDARIDVHFTGHVQGVGFRYSVLQAAKGFEVTGYVENLADGRVHLVAEGERHELDAFVEDIGERMHGHIRKVERSELAGPRQHEGFVIR